MSEKSVNKRIRKILEQDLAEAVADVLRAEANGGTHANGCPSKVLQDVAEQRAQTLGRFEASVRPVLAQLVTPTPGGGAKWGNG